MKEFEIIVKVRECSFGELSEADRRLVVAAKEATQGSYAPYSKFLVGAAIRMADGSILTGANQENAAYPSGLCAERTAAFHASAVKPGMRMDKIAIAARTETDVFDPDSGDDCFQDMPISPCGACRQALLEYETLHGPIEVILYGKSRIYVFPSVASLLPFSFTEF